MSGYSADQLISKLAAARIQLRALIDCLPEPGWLGPQAANLNPPLWEYGHIVWFQERWCLRTQPDGNYAPSLLANADTLYDSSTVPHDTRWGLPLLGMMAVDEYARRVADAIASRLRTELNNELAYYAELCLYHELMHIEAWWMAFQDLGYAPPTPLASVALPRPLRLTFAESEIALGSKPDAGFIFDNEKWQHSVGVPAFDIDATLVRQSDFQEFVESGGYHRHAHWSEAGWTWRNANHVEHPVYWRKQQGIWQVRQFDQWHILQADAPLLHVNLFEAEAYAAWLDEERAKLGIVKDHMALRAKGVGAYGKHAAAKNAGWQKEDVITELDGSSARATEGMVIGRLLRAHQPGEKVKATVLRAGKSVELSLPIQ